MENNQAIKEIKKIERIISKLSKNGYDISILDSNYITLTTSMIADKRNKRIDSINFESKESAIKADEFLYCFQI